jgi:fructose-bisphosphate aldolase class II
MRVPVVPMVEMPQRALAHRHGVVGFDVLDDLSTEAVLAAATEEDAPVVLQTSVQTPDRSAVRVF